MSAYERLGGLVDGEWEVVTRAYEGMDLGSGAEEVMGLRAAAGGGMGWCVDDGVVR